MRHAPLAAALIVLASVVAGAQPVPCENEGGEYYTLPLREYRAGLRPFGPCYPPGTRARVARGERSRESTGILEPRPAPPSKRPRERLFDPERDCEEISWEAFAVLKDEADRQWGPCIMHRSTHGIILECPRLKVAGQTGGLVFWHDRRECNLIERCIGSDGRPIAPEDCPRIERLLSRGSP